MNGMLWREAAVLSENDKELEQGEAEAEAESEEAR